MPNNATTFKAARAENFRQVFLDTDGFAESVTHYPLGVTANGVPYDALVHLNAEGQTLVDDRHGSQLVREGRVTLDATVTVTVDELPQNRDTFLLRGELWQAKKILTRTPYRQVVQVERTQGVSTTMTRIVR